MAWLTAPGRSGRTRPSASARDAGHAEVTRRARRSALRLVGTVSAAGLLQAFAVGWVLHGLHDDPAEAHEAVYVPPVLHWLRDSALSVPGGLLLLFGATLVARRLATRDGGAGDGAGAYPLWAGLGAVAYAVASVPAALLHARLFEAGHEEVSFALHSAVEGIVTLRYSFVLLLGLAMAIGLPWMKPRRSVASRLRLRLRLHLHRKPTTTWEGR